MFPAITSAIKNWFSDRGEPISLDLKYAGSFAGEAIEGGIVGLIIDARGRPLSLPSDSTYRRAKLTQWRQAIGG